MFYFIFLNIIICVLEIYLICNLYGFAFEKRISDRRIQIVTVILLEISMLCVNSLEIAVVNIICIIFFTAIWGCILFKVTFGLSLICCSLYYIVASVGEVIGGFIYSMIVPERQYISETYSISFFIILILERVILFISLKIWQFMKNKYESIGCKEMLLEFFVLPISTLFVLIGITQFNFSVDMQIQQKIILLIGCFLLIFSNIFVFHMLGRLSNMMEKNKIMEIINTKAMMEQKYYDNLDKIEQERKEFMHDIHKHLRIMTILLENGENDKVLELLEQLHIEMYRLEKKQFCNDKILNAILLDKFDDAANAEIELKISLEQRINMIWIEDLDKIVLIGNLLDNAIEAAKKCKSIKKIGINIFKGNNDYLIIIIWNTFNEKLIQVKGNYITSKKDKKNHGIGIKKVKGIVVKYGGIMETKVENNIFKIELYLPMTLK